MKPKTRVGVLFGGKSAEHEVSLQSAKNIVDALDPAQFDIVLVGIDKEGSWHQLPTEKFLINSQNPKAIALSPSKNDNNDGAAIQHLTKSTGIDVVFPVLHGPLGEDGTVQGMLRVLDIPFVGSDVLGSALGMDKDVMKRLLRDAGLPVAGFLVYGENSRPEFDEIVDELGLPFFVKPANLGSSVGVNKVHDRSEFRNAIDEAFKYDSKIVLEQFIKGREVECGVLGNDKPRASRVGEIIPSHEFYSYDAKYIDENGAKLVIPADLTKDIEEKIQKLSIKVFQTLCASGMARVDFFLSTKGKIFVNEINTIPGFTKISMYPKLWEVSGIGYSELISTLIKLAIEKSNKRRSLK